MVLRERNHTLPEGKAKSSYFLHFKSPQISKMDQRGGPHIDILHHGILHLEILLLRFCLVRATMLVHVSIYVCMYQKLFQVATNSNPCPRKSQIPKVPLTSE